MNQWTVLPLRQRIAMRVDGPDANGCLLWTGARDRDGYGQISHQGKQLKAHRVAWELAHGTIPDGLWVLHRCDVPACVAVDHLFLGTVSDNNQDKAMKGRAISGNSLKTECPRGHPYSGPNLRENRHGRYCRACTKMHNDARTRAKREARMARVTP